MNVDGCSKDWLGEMLAWSDVCLAGGPVPTGNGASALGKSIPIIFL